MSPATQKEVILFVGLHKTATSSIQKTCAKNGKMLFDAGLYYPIITWDGTRLANHTRIFNSMFKHAPGRRGFGNQFALEDDSNVLRDRKNLRAAFSAALKDAPTILVVAEGISLLGVEELRDIREWFDRQGRRVRVICHVRHLSSWINSMVSQRVTSPFRLSIEAAADEFVRYTGGFVRPRIENIRAVFPDAEFYSHERAVEHARGPAGFFLETAGLKVGPDVKFVRANEGRSDCATRLMSVVNERFGFFNARGLPSPHALDKADALNAMVRIKGRKFTLRPNEAAPLLPHLHAENAWLKEVFGTDFHDDRMEFPATTCDWSGESMGQLRQAMNALPGHVRDWVLSRLESIDLDASALTQRTA